MAADRIYFVSAGDKEYLVRATRQGPALMTVANASHTVRVATQNDLERLLAKGTKVHSAGDPMEAEEPFPVGGTAATT